MNKRTNKKGERTRADLIAVARRLFAENGYSSTSLQDIIEPVGVTKGSFYHHFESKEQVLRAILEQLAQELGEEIKTTVQAFADPWDRLTAAYDVYAQTARRWEIQQLFYRDAVLVLGFREWSLLDRAFGTSTIESLWREIVPSMKDPTINPRWLAIMLSGSLDYLTDAAAAEQKEESFDIAYTTFRSVLSSLRP